MSLLQMAEYRISIYGRKQSEWDQMASWIVNNELYSENVVWLIQVRIRMCHILKNKFIYIYIGWNGNLRCFAVPAITLQLYRAKFLVIFSFLKFVASEWRVRWLYSFGSCPPLWGSYVEEKHWIWSIYILSYHSAILFVFSAPTTVQCVQGNGNCDVFSEHSWQYLYSAIWGYSGSRFTSSVACFLETGMLSCF